MKLMKDEISVVHVMTSTQTLVFLEAHSKAVQKKGVVYHVFANAKLFDYPQSESLKVHQIDLSRDLLSLGDIRSFFQIIFLLRKIRPNVVLVSTPKAALIGSIACRLSFIGIKPVLLIRGLRSLTLLGWKKRIVRVMECVPVFLSSRTYTTSSQSVEELKKMLPRNFNFSISCVLNGTANGLNLSKFVSLEKLKARQSISKRFDLESDAFIILFVGRVAIDKGVGELCAAFSEVKKTNNEVVLLVVGQDDESDLPSLETLASLDQVAIRVGQIQNDDLPEYYSAADLLVFPSRREGFGIAAIEAAASGTPTLASKIGGLQSAVKDGESGWFFEPGNAGDLKEKLTVLVNDRSSVATMGVSARDFARRKFDSSAYDEFWLDVYRKCGKFFK